MLRAIERIRTPSPDVFLDVYVRAARPVIFTDLLDGQPVRELNTLAKASSVLGHMPVLVTQEYVSLAFGLIAEHIVGSPEPAGDPAATGAAEKVIRRESTFAEYVALAGTDDGAKLLCTENPIDEALVKTFAWPTDLFVPREDAQPGAMTSFMFLGHPGTVSAMHFDGDIASLLHYQVFGRKRHILAEPRVAKKLLPIDAFSTVLLNNFGEDDKQAFASYLDAYDCVLEPGETLYMPPQFWHHVEYVDTAFSFNMRFGRNAYTRFVHSRFHRDLYRQNIAAKLADVELVEREYLDYFRALETASNRAYGNPREKHHSIRALFKQIYSEICPEAIQEDYSITSLHEAIEDRLVAMAHIYDYNYMGARGG